MLSAYAQALCQRILDEQGYLVMSGNREYAVGEVMTGASIRADESELFPPLVVSGIATAADYSRQREVYFARGPASPSGPNFHKVVLE